MESQNLTTWLQHDLGLKNMSEADLAGLMYHPRHGTLCRRFLKFLAESTLCSRKYPDVNAQEEFQAASQELEEKKVELYDIIDKLDERVRSREILERELDSLRQRHEFVKRIEDLIKTTNEALEQMAERPNFCFEKVRRNLEDPSYLDSAHLEPIYELDKLIESRAPRELNERHKRKVEDQYKQTLEAAESQLKAIRLLHREALSLANDAGLGDLKRSTIDEFEALKIPKCVEVEVEINQEERELERERNELKANIALERQQVAELRRQHLSERASLNRKYERELAEELDFLKSVINHETLLLGDCGPEEQQQQ